ncbi:hypothetical protein LINPERHAP2_LOCUS5560 [Linum perenne]
MIMVKLCGRKFVWLDEAKKMVVEDVGLEFGYEYYEYEAMYCLESLVKIFNLHQEVDDDDDSYSCKLVKRKEHLRKLADQEMAWKSRCPSLTYFPFLNFEFPLLQDLFIDDLWPEED